MKPHHVLLIAGGGSHDTDAAARVFGGLIEQAGWNVSATSDPAAAMYAGNGKFNVVMLYTHGDFFTDEQVTALTQFVRGGGGLVGVHTAAATNKTSDAYARLIGSRFAGHGPVVDFAVNITDAAHPLVHRVADFRATDEIYLLDKHADFQPFMGAWWGGSQVPLGYTRTEGEGRVVYIALGHDAQAWSHPTFQKLLMRAVRYAGGEDWADKTVKVAAIGYGGEFNMGRKHQQSCMVAGMTPVAVCDIDIRRANAAKQELGDHIQTYDSVSALLDRSEAELCVVITPHNTHAPISIECLQAGRHVVTEKPFTVTIDEATQVIETARAVNRMASVFHNRRWDGDFVTIRNLVQKGVIGDVFHIECFFGGFDEPRTDWWRSYKKQSGGAFYDWGAHFVDWVLNLIPHPIESVAGDFKKLKWHQVSNEDYTMAHIRFAGGRSAILEQSAISAIPKSRWRILGTHGGIQQATMSLTDPLHVVSIQNGVRVESKVPIIDREWDGFYRNVADHLLIGEPLAVTAESARDVIAVLSLAEQSSAQGGAPLRLPYADAR